ncbi:DUF3152 domain-containing protein [Streptomyces pratensis]|uniref:DUF3152 domain-containing protein n=1 Tax=Streptomyces pratensis TaxID=1169025 RepID=UPI003018F642
MGRHSRKGSEALRPEAAAAEPGGGERSASRTAPGSGRRRRTPAPAADDGRSAFSADAPLTRGGHPEQREGGGGWGAGPLPRSGEARGRPYGAGPGPLPYPPRQQPAPDHGEGARPPAQAASADSGTSGPPGVPEHSGAPGRTGPSGRTDAVAADPAGPSGRQHGAARQEAVERQVSAQRAAQRAADGRAARQPAASPHVPGPRREFVDAFDDEPPEPRAAEPPSAPPAYPAGDGEGEPAERRATGGGRGRTLTGVAAAAVTTVLAVVVAGQVAEDSGDRATASGTEQRADPEEAARSDARPTPESPSAEPDVQPLSYADRMAKPYAIPPDLTAEGSFEAVPGLAKAPGKGVKRRYRVDVEKGLPLDAGLFAEAVHKTLNDDRSWAHNGAMAFERISSGDPDFVITLASPGTTGEWCAKSGLDTTIDNVSCDSAATDRIMINAYRWAQGAATFGPDKLLAYRQMLINHEVGHRLGHNHVNCSTPGALAPVMQQQTKTLTLQGITCKPNAWVYPKG